MSTPSRRPTRPVAVGPKGVLAVGIASAFGVAAFGWPFLVSDRSGLTGGLDEWLVFGGLLALVIVTVLTLLAEGTMDAKAVAMLGVLSAVAAAVRPLGAGTAGIEPLFFVIILGGRAFGPGFGFVLGCTSLFSSALLTGGVGPWLPFQMFAAAWVAMGAGLLPRADGRREVALLAAYGAVAAFFYGLVMNLTFWPFTLGPNTSISFVPGEPAIDNLIRFFAYDFATSLGWDLGRAITTALLVALTARPMLRALRRAGRRAAFDAVPDFAVADSRPSSDPAPLPGDHEVPWSVVPGIAVFEPTKES
ncbi:MAG: ECF transporter S component [Geodermatophilaceae bacterium]